MITGETKSGFKFKIKDSIKDDYYLWKLIAKARKDPMTMYEVNERLLGSDQLKKLEKHCSKKDDFVSSEQLMNEVGEIFDIIGKESSDTKNS